MNSDLKLTPAGANLIKHFEGIHRQCGPDRYAAYKCPAGVVTICYGHTSHHGRKVAMGDVWSKAECDAELLSDMHIFEGDVQRLVKVRLTPWQFDALVSFTFNVGIGAFGGSTMLKKINKGDFEGAALEFHRWNKAGGKPLDGLTRRRASEALLFQNICDLDYDGKPDKAIVPMYEPMPQKVDAPKAV